jgi:hypothetical protein
MQSRSYERLLVTAEQQLLFFALLAERFRRFLGALARAFRGAYVVGVVIRFLHRDLQNKTSGLSSQDFFARLGYTKVTGGGTHIPPPVFSFNYVVAGRPRNRWTMKEITARAIRI